MLAAIVKIDDDDDARPLADGNYGVLPADVLYDILLRLPANHLCRLRLVCRSWRSLTSDPLFELADCLVMVHRNIKDSMTDLWYIEDTSESLWTKRCSIRWTTIADFQSIGHITPLMVSDGGRIVFWVPEKGIIGAYDPKTSSWINLVRMGDYFAVAMHQGSLLCSGVKVY
ncbi:unnamed protein product [Urochloa decumbens]|uniref:F-box domain-containing protein n=1 Tax=Urochloa decumbens TaxID=240449 RepID=A0ABC8VVX2_9POAL